MPRCLRSAQAAAQPIRSTGPSGSSSVGHRVGSGNHLDSSHSLQTVLVDSLVGQTCQEIPQVGRACPTVPIEDNRPAAEDSPALVAVHIGDPEMVDNSDPYCC